MKILISLGLMLFAACGGKTAATPTVPTSDTGSAAATCCCIVKDKQASLQPVAACASNSGTCEVTEAECHGIEGPIPDGDPAPTP